MAVVADCRVTFLISERRKELWETDQQAYWVLLLIAIGMAVAGFVVRSSPDPQKHAMAQYLGGEQLPCS